MSLDPAGRRLRNALVPGNALLEDHETWSPVVPADINVPPPPTAGGMAACEQCTTRHPLAQLTITANGYLCDPCGVTRARGANPAPMDLENVKVGRGRWWLLPAIFAVGGAITIVYPVFVLVTVVVAAGVGLRLVMRRGL